MSGVSEGSRSQAEGEYAAPSRCALCTTSLPLGPSGQARAWGGGRGFDDSRGKQASGACEQVKVRVSTQWELRAQRPSPFHCTETKRALLTQLSATPALGVLPPISSKVRPRVQVDWGTHATELSVTRPGFLAM